MADQKKKKMSEVELPSISKPKSSAYELEIYTQTPQGTCVCIVKDEHKLNMVPQLPRTTPVIEQWLVLKDTNGDSYGVPVRECIRMGEEWFQANATTQMTEIEQAWTTIDSTKNGCTRKLVVAFLVIVAFCVIFFYSLHRAGLL